MHMFDISLDLGLVISKSLEQREHIMPRQREVLPTWWLERRDM